MRQIKSLSSLLLLLLVAGLFAGCTVISTSTGGHDVANPPYTGPIPVACGTGTTSSGGTPSAQGTGGTISSNGTIVPAGTASTGGGAEPANGPSEGYPHPINLHGTITPGQVTVQLAQQQVASCATILVVIANGLSTNIYATNHHTSCSLVTLQQQVGGVWQSEEQCALGAVTSIQTIQPNTTVTQQLGPGYGSIHAATAWPAGTYRIAFGYSASGTNMPGPQVTVYSPVFTIG